MQPVVLQVVAGQVDVEPVRVVGDGFARSDMVRLGRVEVLDQVVEEAPFPDDGATRIHLHDRIHLRPGGGRLGRIGPGGDQLGVGQVLVGNVERGVCIELRVENPGEIVVRMIIGARLKMTPDRRPVPTDLLETAESARVVGRGVEDAPVVQQVGIVADRPSVDDAALHIQQIGCSADAVEVVTVVGTRRVPVLQLGGPGQCVAGYGCD